MVVEEGDIDGLILLLAVDGVSVHIDIGRPQGPDGSVVGEDVNALAFNPTNSNSKYGPTPEGCSLEA